MSCSFLYWPTSEGAHVNPENKVVCMIKFTANSFKAFSFSVPSHISFPLINEIIVQYTLESI